MPKYISSIEGLGINTTKSLRRISDTVSIGTETWNEMDEPWHESGTIIAEPGYKWVTKWEVGKPYIITKILDTNSKLIGIYCDVSRPVEFIEGGFSFTDLYLDVWQLTGEMPVILDENELDGAVEAGYITREEARSARAVATKIVAGLIRNPDMLDF